MCAKLPAGRIDERIVAADQEIARDRRPHRQENRGREVDVLQQAERVVQTARYLNRFQDHQLLDRAEWAHAAAKGPAKEQRHQQRQEEHRGHDDGDGISRVGERDGDILNRANGADAALPVESEIGDAADGQRQDQFPAASLQNQPHRGC
jgi:hypothetical protein